MPRTLATVEQAVRVLECFDADHTQWSLSDLARHLDLPTSTLHEQLGTLAQSGLLIRSGRGRYRLGWRLLKLSSALYGSLPWYSLAHAEMERLARGTHLLAFVSVLQGEQVICIARSVQGRGGSGPGGAVVEGETRFELPPHATASGKLLYALAGLPLPGAPLFTAHTCAEAWAEQAPRIRAERLAVTRDEWAEGTSSLAVPLRGGDGEVLAALGVSLPTSRLRERDALVRRLRDAADEVAWALGARSFP
ncbi:IclR family transcriptional regulator [Deinococcus wulumuqiensis]|uniref:IclR family transcriptional regulator n=1 Tax=Deinococcus wulumuqiensis TaxID=980427 RepID=A0AAV4K8B0_9DEIO|nr:IclR family transcriptional regulator [Deinococcus wulumuqiensis]QII22061.1 IclR family transcriptional regulator [Deinococcus wulumuqiensis R12]GGI93056.1 IclR family transcriptional regulator [Deinococcus wulumuqiensis]GGP31211.1 IclR family transcriptional regulator [Deinococcus wulumuqiensis]